ncbi:MAG: hypothetical protein SGILL_008689, partial [Bacillariaceae sp.]
KSKRDRNKQEKVIPPGKWLGTKASLSSLKDLTIPFDHSLDIGNPKKVMDFCRKNLQSLTKSDPFSNTAFVLFQVYLRNLKTGTDDVGFVQGNIECFESIYQGTQRWSSDDRRFWRALAADPMQPVFFRVNMYWCLGALHYHANLDQEGTALCYELAIQLIEEIKALEKNQLVFYNVLYGDDEEMSVGCFSVIAQAKMQDHIDLKYRERMRVLSSDSRVTFRSALGGNECKFAFYCSTTCQNTAWKTGHRSVCRKKGDFLPGDQVVAVDHSGHAQLVERVEGKEEWIVIQIAARNRRAVKTKDLFRLRPCLWQCQEAYFPLDAMNKELAKAICESYPEEACSESRIELFRKQLAEERAQGRTP